MNELLAYVNEQAYLADKSSHEWEKAGAAEQAAYRAGMWYAYNDVRNQLPNPSGRQLPGRNKAPLSRR